MRFFDWAATGAPPRRNRPPVERLRHRCAAWVIRAPPAELLGPARRCKPIRSDALFLASHPTGQAQARFAAAIAQNAGIGLRPEITDLGESKTLHARIETIENVWLSLEGVEHGALPCRLRRQEMGDNAVLAIAK